MNMDELMAKVLEIFPDATLGEDNEGQIIVYTNLTQTSDHEVVEFDPE